MNLSAPFIRRPIATTLLTVAVALAGGVAFFFLPVSPLPPIDFPSISVSAALPGASPEIMASSVATPLERQFGRIAGISEMTSISSLGQTSITLIFDLNRDVDGAARDVQAAINAARGYLPSNLPANPSYRKVNPADAPIMIVALTSPSVPPGQLYDAGSTLLVQKLSQIRGVGQVLVGGSSLPAIRVDVNPALLNGLGLQLEDVRQAIAAQTLNRPKGSFANARHSWSIHANDQLLTAGEYPPLIVSYHNGAAVKLGDVAKVATAVEDMRSIGLSNGEPSAALIVFRQPGANIIETVDAIRSQLPKLKAAIDPAIHINVVMDHSVTIRASVHDVERTLAISVVLVVLVVFVFLRSARATLIPSVAVPVSLIGTFGAMYLLGYNIDNFSLMALTIATGFVVDDAIVVLENITRLREGGMAPMEAALKGASEIGFTVLSISLSLVAVFIPILLMQGMAGLLFREFAVTLTVTILISLGVSLTATPMMCARIPESRSHGRLYTATERAFERIQRGYERSLGWALDHSLLMLLLFIATVGLNIALFIAVPKGFFPESDTGSISGSVQGEQDISFQSMEGKLRRLMSIVQADPAVATVTGFTGGGGGTTVNTARFFISLKPLAERPKKASAQEVIARLRPKLSQVPGATLFLQAVQDVRMGGRRSNAEYQYTLQSDDLKELNHFAPLMLRALQRMPGLTDVNSDQQNGGLQAVLDIDRPTAARLGVSAQLIDNTLYDAFGQRQVATRYTPLNQYHVVMDVAPQFWQGPEGLKGIYVKSSRGGMVPLAAFSRYTSSLGPLAVNHQGFFPSTTISFNLQPAVSLGQAVQQINQAKSKLQVPSTIQTNFSGTAQAFQSSESSEGILILAALAAVYIVLGVLYESYIHPITILSTLPSAGVGALLGLLVTGSQLTLIALIGILLLIGIVKKNAIMMVDFALTVERAEGLAPKEAARRASTLRFRPILMTTMAALLGALPLALGSGVGSELRRPLGIAIVGGLLVSQVLTLYTTPVIYLYMDRLRRRGTRWGRAAVGAGALAVSGCSPAPPYHRPEAPPPAAFKEAGSYWKVAQPSDERVRGNWWEEFQDPDLNALEEPVRVSNQTLRAAEAAYRQAQALVTQARASWYPTLSASASVTRSHSSIGGAAAGAGSGAPAGAGGGTIAASPGTRTVYSLPLEASYEFDLWGRVRNAVAQNLRTEEASAADLATATLSVQTEVAQTYFQIRAVDEQRRILDTTLADYQASLRIAHTLFQSGIASEEELSQANTQFESAQAQATDLGIARAQYEHALAVLIGRPPAEFSLPAKRFDPHLPKVPPSVPADLLERRPDIAAAERRVAAANAGIGVARAAYFPNLSLSASAGFQSLSWARWLSSPSFFWSVGPGLAETLFDGGARRAATERARAAYDETVANYRQAVLTAFQSVEDTLTAISILSEEAVQQHRATAAAEHTVGLSVTRFENGLDSYVNVITAQNAFLAARQAELQVQLRQLVGAISLIKNLGGGWDGRTGGMDLPGHGKELGREPWPTGPVGTPNPPALPPPAQKPGQLLQQDAAEMARPSEPAQPSKP